MNVLATFKKRYVKDIFINYCAKHFNIDKLFSEAREQVKKIQGNNETQINNFEMFNMYFECPCSISFDRMITKLLNFDVSHVVIYWILAVIDDLIINNKIKLDAYTLHRYVVLFHNIGTKFIEDSVYDTSIYMEAIGIPINTTVHCEMSLITMILDHTTPTKILASKNIDSKLIDVISSVTGIDVKDVKRMDDLYKNDTETFCI